MDSENPLILPDIKSKLKVIETACHKMLLSEVSYRVPFEIGRDVEIRAMSELPRKKGIGSAQGQARLLHDLANIELQAMEMSFRTLVDFPEAPVEFREQLVELVLDEARHLRLCTGQIENLGWRWGDWPVHTGLWRCLSSEDTLLDRLFIVHRYLEGSGLDAGEKILRRLSEVGQRATTEVIKTIADEEVGHVQFGSRWYRKTCDKLRLDPSKDFQGRARSLYARLPRRLEPMNSGLRKKAGFSQQELGVLKSLQADQLAEKNKESVS